MQHKKPMNQEHMIRKVMKLLQEKPELIKKFAHPMIAQGKDMQAQIAENPQMVEALQEVAGQLGNEDDDVNVQYSIGGAIVVGIVLGAIISVGASIVIASDDFGNSETESSGGNNSGGSTEEGGDDEGGDDSGDSGDTGDSGDGGDDD